MKEATQLTNHPHLKSVLAFYLLLSIVDTVHHLHAALALGHRSAMHSVAINMVLVPIAITLLWLFLHKNRQIFVWAFLAIVILAVLIPGIYHGGWVHIVSILRYFGVAGQTTDVGQLFSPHDIHHWFYEISGISEFFLALVCAYFIVKYSAIRPLDKSM